MRHLKGVCAFCLCRQVLVTVDSQCPEAYQQCNVPLLKKFQAEVAERPNIKAYLASERYGPPSGDSFM
jgi:hypothetical protein